MFASRQKIKDSFETDERNDEGSDSEQFVASDEDDDSVRRVASPEVDLTAFKRLGVGVTHLQN